MCGSLKQPAPMSTNVKILVTFESKEFKVQMPADTDVCHFQQKMRTFLKLKQEDAIFCFFKANKWCTSEMLCQQAMSLAEIQRDSRMTILECSILRESAFGAWSKGFVSAKIEKRKELYVGSIIWSWYSVTTWTEVEIFETLEECKSWILVQRCAGGLTLTL